MVTSLRSVSLPFYQASSRTVIVSCVCFTTLFLRLFAFFDCWRRVTEGGRLSEKLTRGFLGVGCCLCFERLCLPCVGFFDADSLCWLLSWLKSWNSLRFAKLDRSFSQLLEVLWGVWSIFTGNKRDKPEL